MTVGNTSYIPTSPRLKQQSFTIIQKDFLLKFYNNTAHYPTPEEYTDFAKRFFISKHRVQNWFKNRRARSPKRIYKQATRAKSESWNQRSVFKRPAAPPVPRPSIREVRESLIRIQTTRLANAVLCKNPHTFQIQFFQQQSPTFKAKVSFLRTCTRLRLGSRKNENGMHIGKIS